MIAGDSRFLHRIPMRQCQSCYRQFDDALAVCPYDATKLPAPDPLVGRLVDGKYRVVSLLGSGALGRVYRAQHIQLGRTVAVKVTESPNSDKEGIERFGREAVLVARLKHPGLVAVYDFGVADGIGAYLVMEYVDGPSLREELRRGPLPPERAVAVGVQVCDALDAAHSIDLVHCGISPDNILLERTAKGETAKVADFGIARLAGAPDTTPVRAAPGLVIGDPPYMPPEQWAGGHLDERTDIYSVGCVLYEALTGRTPFSASDPIAVGRLHIGEIPAKPSSITPEIPADLESAILRALAKRPEDRFRSAREFAEALASADGPRKNASDRTSGVGSGQPRPAVNPTPTELSPGFVVNGRYRITGRLGQGGMGVVFEAVDERFGSPVALKKTLVEGEALRDAFEREARLLNELRHGALPFVFDYFFEGGAQFLVMQYVPGEDLSQKLVRNGAPFRADAVLAWADQLLDALEYLHSRTRPVIHRDIKPQNLKLTPEGSIILLDFGLAKGHPEYASRLSGASVGGFTPHYAPLEQMRGQGTDVTSDLYALGATLYHLLTGVVPPDAVTRAEEALNHRQDPLRPASKIAPAVPTTVSDILLRAMAMRRDARFGSASAMRAALQQCRSSAIPPASEADTQTLIEGEDTGAAQAGSAEDPDS